MKNLLNFILDKENGKWHNKAIDILHQFKSPKKIVESFSTVKWGNKPREELWGRVLNRKNQSSLQVINQYKAGISKLSADISKRVLGLLEGEKKLVENMQSLDELIKELQYSSIGKKREILKLLANKKIPFKKLKIIWDYFLSNYSSLRNLELEFIRVFEQEQTVMARYKYKFSYYDRYYKGGDIKKGKEFVFHNPTGECLRCHKYKGEGGMVGPDLATVKGKSHKYLVDALINPNKDVAKGFAPIMPSMKKVLSEEQIRNIVRFLSIQD